MLTCKLCGSYAVNPGQYGRPDYDAGVNHDLCDVCFWKTRYEAISAVPIYQVSVSRGNDEGDLSSTGNTWWAYCKDLDVYGDGTTEYAAVSNCLSGMGLKARVMIEKGIALPTPTTNISKKEPSK